MTRLGKPDDELELELDDLELDELELEELELEELELEELEMDELELDELELDELELVDLISGFCCLGSSLLTVSPPPPPQALSASANKIGMRFPLRRVNLGLPTATNIACLLFFCLSLM